MKLLLPTALIAALLAFPAPVKATHTVLSRCSSLVGRVNAYRSPDLRLYNVLCYIGARRARAMAAAGRGWHDLRPVIAALTKHGICWRNVGEVVAWNNYSASARAFVNQWRRSPSHWSLLTASRYDLGGGSWTSSASGHYAASYVLDLCS